MHIFNISKIMYTRCSIFWSSLFPIGSYRWHMRHKDAVMDYPRTRYPWTFFGDQFPGYRDPFAGGGGGGETKSALNLPNSGLYRSDLTHSDITSEPTHRTGHIVQGLIVWGTKNTWSRKSQAQMFTDTLIRDTLSCHRQNSSRDLLGYNGAMMNPGLFLSRWLAYIFCYLGDLELTSNWPRINLGFTGSARRRLFWSEEARPDSPAATTSGSSLRASSETQRSEWKLIPWCDSRGRIHNQRIAVEIARSEKVFSPEIYFPDYACLDRH